MLYFKYIKYILEFLNSYLYIHTDLLTQIVVLTYYSLNILKILNNVINIRLK